MIDFLPQADSREAKVFHAGTSLDDQGQVRTAGGRVLGVTTVADTVAQARERAYALCDIVSWPGMQYRRDIGQNGAPM